MNIFEEGSEFLNDELRENASTLVTYRRGSNTLSILAEFGKTMFSVSQPNGMLIDVESRDFLFDAAELLLASEQIIPQKGDLIIDGSHMFEVYSPTGEQPYRSCDPFGHRVRVHTRRIEVRP